MRLQRVAIAAAFLSAGIAYDADGAGSTDARVQASIPFASQNIYTWLADGEKGIWVQALGPQWYYAEFMFPCAAIQFRDAVHFKFGPAGELDRWGAVIVPHVPQCFFRSFTRSAGPPPKKARFPQPKIPELLSAVPA